MEQFIHFLKEHLLQCPIKSTIGMNCLGCGLQRSFLLLLEGNLSASFVMYPALIPMILMLGFLLLHIIYNFKKGAKILKFFYILNSIIIVINYIIKF
ncbi:DUF2752 domain-containing protein [Aquimarina rhabdastrellae]